MPKPRPNYDVLVLGAHPCAYLAAAVLRHNSKLKVLHSIIPGEDAPDRLVLLNPALFARHALLGPLSRKIPHHLLYGARFLGDDLATRCEHRSRSALTSVISLHAVRNALRNLAARMKVDLARPRHLNILQLDETGLDIEIGPEQVRAKALVLAGRLDPAQERMLAMPEAWEDGILHRYTFVRLSRSDLVENDRPLLSMSLDLRGMLLWAWLLPGRQQAQLAVVQPSPTLTRIAPQELLAAWVDVLRQHGVLASSAAPPLHTAQSIDIPLAGALAHEGVGNRTLLIGPAGGFYTASAEDIYPNCWSALFAADALKRALKQPHLQDALHLYHHKWRTTLGQYLRGPQQNLRFLLPLVYRNQVMTTRLVEAILQGKSVVR